MKSLLILIFAFAYTSSFAYENIVVLNYTMHPPMGTTNEAERNLQSTPETKGYQLKYNCFIGEKYGYYLGIGHFREDTKYELYESESITRDFSSEMAGYTLGVGAWLFDSSKFRIYGGINYGKATMDFKGNGANTIKVRGIKATEYEINGLKEFGRFGLNFGINVTDYNVDEFDYNGTQFNSDDFQGDVNFKVGITFHF